VAGFEYNRKHEEKYHLHTRCLRDGEQESCYTRIPEWISISLSKGRKNARLSFSQSNIPYSVECSLEEAEKELELAISFPTEKRMEIYRQAETESDNAAKAFMDDQMEKLFKIGCLDPHKARDIVSITDPSRVQSTIDWVYLAMNALVLRNIKGGTEKNIYDAESTLIAVLRGMIEAGGGMTHKRIIDVLLFMRLPVPSYSEKDLWVTLKGSLEILLDGLPPKLINEKGSDEVKIAA